MVTIKINKNNKNHQYLLLVAINLIVFLLIYILEIEEEKHFFLLILFSLIYMIFAIFKNPFSLTFEELKSYDADKIKNIYYMYWFFHILIALVVIYALFKFIFSSEKHLLIKSLNTIFFLKSISPKNPLFDKNYFIFF